MEYSKKIMDLVESWINGNRTHVRTVAKKELSKKGVASLTLAIGEFDSKEQAHKFAELLTQ